MLSQPTAIDNSAAFQLTPALEETLCRFITQRTGIVIQDHQLKNLREVVARACRRYGYSDCRPYLAAMEADQLVTPELEFLIAGITVGESYFFRDEESMDLLRNELLPQLIAQKRASGNLSLRIWSAGCSMGQEIYTLAMMLEDLLPDRKNWNLHLLATDINTEALRLGVHGQYDNWSFRATPAAVRGRFFVPAGHDFAIKPALRKSVKFAYLNLAEDPFPSVLSETHHMDLILCRNVFIYLAPQVAQCIMAKFADALVDDGLLLLGPSDLVGWSAPDFDYIPGNKTYYFRRQDQAAIAKPHAAALPGQPPHKPSAPIRPNQAQLLLRQRTPGHTPQQAKAKQATACDFDEVTALLRAEHWRDALALLTRWPEDQVNAKIKYCQAAALANLGEMNQALQACATGITLDPTEKHVYLIQGIVLNELDRPEEAIAALRKAIYLDHLFLEAHYQLGQLLLHTGQAAAGRKSLHNALQLAVQGDPERELHNAMGMTYRRFAHILRNEIEMYDSHTQGSAQDKQPLNIPASATEPHHG